MGQACPTSVLLYYTLLPSFSLTAKTSMYPKTHLLLEGFPGDALHQSVFLSLGLLQHGAHYSVPALIPELFVQVPSSPLVWEWLTEGPGPY